MSGGGQDQGDTTTGLSPIEPADAEVRKQALTPDKSYIVQAPAGSGKTDLLTRRILTLLSRVQQPEEILAITFTRKAASEMRQRVLKLLQLARDRTLLNDEQRADGHLQDALHLADAVLRQDAAQQWSLLDNPSRLSLQTIDSLCAVLTRQMPVTSYFGAALPVEENAGRLYQIAASRCIEDQLSAGPADGALPVLLEHLDNNADRLQQLLTSMLARRDQWLRPDYLDAEARESFELAIREWVEERYAVLAANQPSVVGNSLAPILSQVAAIARVLDKPESAIAFEDCLELPPASIEHAAFWQAFADCVLTQKNELRKSLTRQSGFPTSAADAKLLGIPVADLKTSKSAFTDVLEALAEHEPFVALLAEIRTLPMTGYDDRQWEVIESLLQVVLSAVAQLHLVFAEHGHVDFTEISMRAARALGDSEDPTNLALVLDYRLSHILVDEFQDTSLSQFELFVRLVAGWEPGDGRTFFAVGDPMQSIYRFRNAEVGLFLDAQRRGIGNVALEPLQLTVNFRSRPAVVNWCNAVFAELFPLQPDSRAGAITYSPSVPFRAKDKTAGCQVHAFLERDWAEQAARVAQVVEQSLDQTTGDIAILVRSKSSLTEIFAALQRQQIAYQAIDIETLGDRLIVKDLQSLAAALLHPLDRLHWLAVLRAPWCGLTLNDLHALAGADADSTDQQNDAPSEAHTSEGTREGQQVDMFAPAEIITPAPRKNAASLWSRLLSSEVLQRLSVDGQQRVQRLITILAPALERSGREPLVPWLESCWLKLAGPAGASATDRLAAEACLRELTVIEADGLLWDARYVNTRLQALFAPPEQGENVRVQMMTIHKSKGLEFETVLLPSLGRQTAQDQNQLLNWFEYNNQEGMPRLLVAPIAEANMDSRQSGPLLKLVRKQQQYKSDNELLRLLYVAATRARKNLHLFANAEDRDGQFVRPAKNSLLAPLWPVLEPDFEAQREHVAGTDAEQSADNTETPAASAATPPPLLRIPVDTPVMDFTDHWIDYTGSASESSTDEVLEFDWAGLDARYIGTVVHRQLQRISEEGVDNWTVERVVAQQTFYRQQLAQQGVPEAGLPAALDRLVRALQNVLEDPRAQWLLSPHPEARSEYRLTGYLDDKLVNKIIDRTFVDNDVRWIVDYKTGDHRGGRLEEFLDREQQRYRHQLEEYVDIMRHIDRRPIRLGLYFPLLQGFREWEPDPERAAAF